MLYTSGRYGLACVLVWILTSCAKIIGPALAGSAGPVPPPLCAHVCMLIIMHVCISKVSVHLDPGRWWINSCILGDYPLFSGVTVLRGSTNSKAKCFEYLGLFTACFCVPKSDEQLSQSNTCTMLASITHCGSGVACTWQCEKTTPHNDIHMLAGVVAMTQRL